MAGRGKNVSPQILQYLSKNPYKQIVVEDIAQHFGMSVLQVQNAIQRLRNRHGMDGQIDVVIAGHVWLYRPVPSKKTATRRMFEELAETKSGHILIQDENGTVYLAKEVDG